MDVLRDENSPCPRDELLGGRGGEKNYEPPPIFTTNITITDLSATANITPEKAEMPSAESIKTAPSEGTEASSTSSDEAVKKEDSKINTNAIENPCGCCATEAFEIEYDKDRFAHLTTNTKKILVPEKLSSFSYRWTSFKDDHFGNLCFGRLWNRRRTTSCGGDHDEHTVSSGSFTNQFYEYHNDANADESSEKYQHFGSFFRCGKTTKQVKKSYPLALDADLDVLARNPCNEYARRQFEIWRAASIEGPRGLKTTAFCVALILLLCTVGMIIAKGRQQFWTPGAVVACFHLVVALLLILVLESRSNLTGKGILRDLVTCGCSGKTVEDDMTDNFYHVTILPMDTYQEYGDQHYATENDAISKPRHDVIINVRFFRYLHGRGCLCIFAGSMAFCTIPGHLSDYPGAALAVCAPGIALVLVGLTAVMVGLHATFRWALLETSIVGGDDHLLDKFLSAGRTLFDDESEHEDSIDSLGCLNQNGFSILVTTLGLDLDETTLIPTVFALEVRPKDPNAMTFEEFQKWWKGQEGRHRKRTVSHGTMSTNSSGKDETTLSSLRSSAQGSVV